MIICLIVLSRLEIHNHLETIRDMILFAYLYLKSATPVLISYIYLDILRDFFFFWLRGSQINL